jgi:hypothetical protein
MLKKDENQLKIPKRQESPGDGRQHQTEGREQGNDSEQIRAFPLLSGWSGVEGPVQ